VSPAGCSYKFRYRSVLQGWPIGQIENRLVDVAPTPMLGWVVAFDNGVAGGVKMLGRVLVRRIVAAADVPALAADAQMDPPVSGRETVLTSERARRDITNGIEMGACLCHLYTPVSSSRCSGD